MKIDRKAIFMIFSLCCFAAAGVCVIVDFYLSGELTWAYIPLVSIPFGWFVLSPLLLRRNRLLFVLAAATAMILPYLYLLEKTLPHAGWYYAIGVPSAAVFIILAWIVYLLFRFAKISVLYKSAVVVFLVGIVADPYINRVVDQYTGVVSSSADRWISIFGCLIAAAVLVILGYMRTQAQKSK